MNEWVNGLQVIALIFKWLLWATFLLYPIFCNYWQCNLFKILVSSCQLPAGEPIMDFLCQLDWVHMFSLAFKASSYLVSFIFHSFLTGILDTLSNPAVLPYSLLLWFCSCHSFPLSFLWPSFSPTTSVKSFLVILTQDISLRSCCI